MLIVFIFIKRFSPAYVLKWLFLKLTVIYTINRHLKLSPLNQVLEIFQKSLTSRQVFFTIDRRTGKTADVKIYFQQQRTKSINRTTKE